MEKFDKKMMHITFDIDWACDAVLEYTVDIIEKENIKATFFVTHDTPLLTRLRSNSKIELGIHPNFNKLFEQHTTDSARKVLEKCLEIVPEAKSIRTHCLVQSSSLLELYKEYGLSHDASFFTPQQEIQLKPFWHWNGLVRIPYQWEDDVHCINIKNGFAADWNINDYIVRDSIKAFDFHPIHIFLNTENLKRYEASRPYHHNEKQLLRYVNKDDAAGTKVFLHNLIKAAKQNSLQFSLIGETRP